MKSATILAFFALAACGRAHESPPRIETVEVKVPVPVSCVTRDQIAALPEEPAKIEWTGNAAVDIGPVGIVALQWKKIATAAKALLEGCVLPD